MPWGLMKIPDEEFVPRYRARLERDGAGAIQARFDKLHELYRRPLMLLCFEKDVAVEPCHRRAFADWWLEQTGQLVPEADGLDADAISRAL